MTYVKGEKVTVEGRVKTLAKKVAHMTDANEEEIA